MTKTTKQRRRTVVGVVELIRKRLDEAKADCQKRRGSVPGLAGSFGDHPGHPGQTRRKPLVTRKRATMSSEPRLIEDMSFADYLGDPADEPSVTAGILRELLNGTPRHVWERTPRLNANASPENKAAFDLGSAAHALFVGHGAALDVCQEDSWRTNYAKAARVESTTMDTRLSWGKNSRGRGDGGRCHGAVRPARGDRSSLARDGPRDDDHMERGRGDEPLPTRLPEPGRDRPLQDDGDTPKPSGAAALRRWSRVGSHRRALRRRRQGSHRHRAEAVFRRPGKHAALSRAGGGTRSDLRRVAERCAGSSPLASGRSASARTCGQGIRPGRSGSNARRGTKR